MTRRLLIDRATLFDSAAGVLRPNCKIVIEADTIVAVSDEPITVGDVTLRSGASCGGARCPDDGVTLDDLVRAADARMYEAKAQRPD